MKFLKKFLTALLCLVIALTAVFFAGRYGWKLAGFRACEGAGISSVEVRERAVTITGFYPGSFPEGFCGCYSRERDGTLYVGFRFSAIFGFFETGNFQVTIPVEGDIHRVVLKTRNLEADLWDKQTGFYPQSEQYGVYVKLERTDAYTVSISYADFSGGLCRADVSALESGEYSFLDNDIMMAAKEAEGPVPFTITVKDASGTGIASGSFLFDPNSEKMYLTVKQDDTIVEDSTYR